RLLPRPPHPAAAAARLALVRLLIPTPAPVAASLAATGAAFSAAHGPMIASTLTLVAQLAALALPAMPAQPTPQETPPVLAFPEPGLDDPAAFEGYRTRFHRDAAGNVVQIYLDAKSGRVVH